jgi:hypothetical protein
MHMPQTISFQLPKKYTPETGGGDILPGDIIDVQIGFAPAGTAAGVYPLVADDPAFAAQTDATGLVTIPYDTLGESLAPGDYVAAARVKTAQAVSDWSAPATFTIAAPPIPVPMPPTGFSVA